MKRHELLWALLISLSVGCGGATKEAKTPADMPDDSSAVDDTASSDMTDSPPAADTDQGSSSDEPKSELGDDLPPPVPESWEPNQTDCEELSDQYEGLLRKKEIAKLEKRHLSDKSKSVPGIERAVKQGKANWLQACQKIIGTTQVHKRWICASKAKDMDRFNGCMDGKFDSELPDD